MNIKLEISVFIVSSVFRVYIDNTRGHKVSALRFQFPVFVYINMFVEIFVFTYSAHVNIL